MNYKNNQNNQRFPAEITFAANFNESSNSLGGKLIITPQLLVFRPHSLNLGDLSDRIFDIRNITGYKKGFMTFLYIYFNNGQAISLSVWKKQQIIDELENRKRAMGC